MVDLRKFFGWQYHGFLYAIKVIFVLLVICFLTLGCEKKMFFGIISWVGVVCFFGFYYVIHALNKGAVGLE